MKAAATVFEGMDENEAESGGGNDGIQIVLFATCGIGEQPDDKQRDRLLWR